MAVTKGSDNEFPSVLFVEQGSDPATPAAGTQRLFVDRADGLLKLIDETGTVTDVGGAGSGSVATDVIWDAAGDLAVGTGADTAAKLTKGSAGGRLAMGNSAVIWNAGTSFPGSKATGDTYRRTDVLGGTDFTWDGTRWRSHVLVQSFQIIDTAMFAGISITTSPIARMVLPLVGSFTIYAISVTLGAFVSTTNDGSKNWTFAFTSIPSATAVGAGLTTAADTASTHTTHTMAIGAVLNSTDVYVTFPATKVSTPGNLIVTGAALTYQLVTT